MGGANGEVHGFAVGRKANGALVVGRVDGRYGFGTFPISLFVDASHVNVTVFEPGDAGKLIAECGCARRGEVKLAVFPLYK